MTRLAPNRAVRLVVALAAAWPGLPAAGAEPRATTSAPVELPPMMVEESVSSVPWLYVNAGGTEFLSRCSVGTTRQLAEGWLTKMQLVRTLVPEEFLARMDVPSVFVLYAQDLKLTVSAEIQKELQAAGERGGGVAIAPSMRLSDRDMYASIVYVDEAQFDAATMSVSPNHVRYLLKARVPELPAWLVDGVVRAWLRTDFVLEPITFRPLVWLNPRDSDALAGDAARPRALLPACELFGPAAGAENEHPRRRAVRTSTQELFFRWATVSSDAMREAFWRFARRAAEGPVTEEMFEADFGFDFAELRDRLSDYLPKAVRETTRIHPGRLPPLPDFEVRRATPNEIARVRGEWERLAIGHVQRRLPEAREPYLAQARRTLRRAYDAGDRDPRLLATMGLCEIDAGNEAAARELLEMAAAGGVARPRAYYELARLRFAALPRDGSDLPRFSFTALAPTIEPLRRALTQAPPLPEVYILLADVWASAATPPNTAEFAELEMGARLFAARPDVAYPIALALARHGKRTDAAAVLETAVRYATDDESRTEIERLRTELATTPGRGTTDEATAASR